MAKNVTRSSENFTKKHAINISTACSLQEVAGTKLVGIQAAAIVDDIDRETGETKQVAAFVDSNGIMYTSISSVVMESMDDIIDLLDEGEHFDLQVLARKTKSSNRDYLSVVVL